MKPIFVIAAVIIAISFFVNIGNASQIDEVKSCKVLKLIQQQQIEGTSKDISTEYRYLVITDKETFICETSTLNMKVNNSDIFFRLEKDSVYNFKVEGYGKSIATDYRNILEFSKP